MQLVDDIPTLLALCARSKDPACRRAFLERVLGLQEEALGPAHADVVRMRCSRSAL